LGPKGSRGFESPLLRHSVVTLYHLITPRPE
jgi:hypothetical protein